MTPWAYRFATCANAKSRWMSFWKILSTKKVSHSNMLFAPLWQYQNWNGYECHRVTIQIFEGNFVERPYCNANGTQEYDNGRCLQILLWIRHLPKNIRFGNGAFLPKSRICFLVSRRWDERTVILFAGHELWESVFPTIIIPITIVPTIGTMPENSRRPRPFAARQNKKSTNTNLRRTNKPIFNIAENCG